MLKKKSKVTSALFSAALVLPIGSIAFLLWKSRNRPRPVQEPGNNFIEIPPYYDIEDADSLEEKLPDDLRYEEIPWDDVPERQYFPRDENLPVVITIPPNVRSEAGDVDL